MSQERVRKPAPKERVAEEPVEPVTDEERDAKLAELDALLADIDEALGENLENAQEFMANWIQKGGE